MDSFDGIFASGIYGSSRAGNESVSCNISDERMAIITDRCKKTITGIHLPGSATNENDAARTLLSHNW